MVSIGKDNVSFTKNIKRLKYTGHRDYKSMKPYIDIDEKAKTDAMDAMDKALGKKPTFCAESVNGL